MNNINVPSFWEKLEIEQAGNANAIWDARSIAQGLLIKDALINNTCITSFSKEGTFSISGKNTMDAIKDFLIQEKKGKLVSKTIDNHSCLFAWNYGLASVDFSGNFLSLDCCSADDQLMKDIKDFCAPHWVAAEKTGTVYTIVRYGGSFSLSLVGKAGLQLIESNYSKQVMDDFKYVIKDLNTKDPSGRISILRGPPGSGKTRLIRAMLNMVPSSIFVLVPPELITELSGPNIIPLLLQYRGGAKGPIILILEDADKCLVQRKDGNINEIQSLLNLGDGILGSMLDIRIVATTNAETINFDDALKRRGRLSKLITVEKLEYKEANAVFSRLLPGKQLPETDANSNISLADIYGLARDGGWEPEANKISIIEDVSDKDMLDVQPEEVDDYTFN